jgi:hypothetical protein
MADDKAKAWLTLADADAVEAKVVDVVNRMFSGDHPHVVPNLEAFAQRLSGSFQMQNAIASYIGPQIRQTIREEVKNNLRVDHYYEQYNRTAGYRIRYGNDVIQQEQIKIGY